MTETAVGFGYKLQWLAVHDRGADEVAAALKLTPPTAATWSDAVASAYGGDWLLTPRLDRWTLAASTQMPVPFEGDLFPAWLAGLSRVLGEVQYFGTHRVSDYHAWGRARDGVVERAFGWLGERGETLFHVGEPTADERALGVGVVVDGDEPWPEDDDAAWPWPTEETVLTLAGRWSVDPRGLDGFPTPAHPWIATVRKGGMASLVRAPNPDVPTAHRTSFD